MLLEELLDNPIFETPLPPDWDKEVFVPRNSFAARVRYATERAQKIGAGSSRIAFEIEYQGRPTILKIAKNRKGEAQNELEAELMTDHYFTSHELAVPIIDYDEESSMPTWIHMEKAGKITKSKFKSITGVTLEELVGFLHKLAGNRSIFYPHPSDERYDEMWEIEFVSDMANITQNYDLGSDDFGTIKNWGLYKGNAVLVDVGLNTEIYKLHYDPRRDR